jgi:GTP-binding protein
LRKVKTNFTVVNKVDNAMREPDAVNYNLGLGEYFTIASNRQTGELLNALVAEMPPEPLAVRSRSVTKICDWLEDSTENHLCSML